MTAVKWNVVTSTWDDAGELDAQFCPGTDNTIGGKININTNKSIYASNGTWMDHPAFTFNGIKLTVPKAGDYKLEGWGAESGGGG